MSVLEKRSNVTSSVGVFGGGEKLLGGRAVVSSRVLLIAKVEGVVPLRIDTKRCEVRKLPFLFVEEVNCLDLRIGTRMKVVSHPEVVRRGQRHARHRSHFGV